jgi:Secretion system C-terminal sorting domain
MSNWAEATLRENTYAAGVGTSDVGSPGTRGSGQILPVVWAYFDVKPSGSAVQLKWSTFIEVQTDYFLVEKKTPNTGFYEIGKVKAAGNANKQLFYTFFDESPATGLNYYRLKQFDLNGAFQFSAVKQAFISDNHEISVFPVPADKFLHLQWPGNEIPEIQFLISDMNGLIVMHRVISKTAGRDISIPLSHLPAGMYFLKIIDSANQFPLFKGMLPIVH